jgi:hypothetical protein
VKGSGSGESRACKFSQRLAVVLESDMGGDVLQLQVPAASLFGQAESENMPLKAYANWLGAQNISPDEVVTRMSLLPRHSRPSFSSVQFAGWMMTSTTLSLRRAVLKKPKRPSR